MTGAAQRNARWHELTEAEAAELEEIAAGLTDLLAEVTEILTGFHQGDLEEPEAKAPAELGRLAGADETLIRSGWRGHGAGPRSYGECHRADRQLRQLADGPKGAGIKGSGYCRAAEGRGCLPPPSW